MRTTVTLDDDVAAIIENEQRRSGESFRTTVNRLVRRGAVTNPSRPALPLPELPGQPTLDISDISAALAALDEERRSERNFP
jgi:hypothetical protein